MVFSSLLFLFLFLPVVLLTHFLLPKGTARNYHLLGCSLLFYAWGEPSFLLLMLLSITVNHGFGRLLVRHDKSPQRRLKVVWLAVLFNIGMLAFSKYANFVADNLNRLGAWLGLGPVMNLPAIALPLGISFFTFHALSYVIDVYRRKCPAQTQWSITALYFVFFPQLIAGPIIRYSQVAWQFSVRQVSLSSFRLGMGRFAIGLGKKVVIANPLGAAADQIFGLPTGQMGMDVAWLGIICYTLQIYFDFSGYSDMAIGLARMFGFRFPENFNYPYVAKSVREFWRRWHISLSNWLRDYLYVSLGGNRKGVARTYANLLTVFLLCGLWHGASWNFVAWGAFHGLFLILERLGLEAILRRLGAPVQHAYTLLVVMLAWVLFRTGTISEAWSFIRRLFSWSSLGLSQGIGAFLTAEISFTLLLAVLFVTPHLARATRRLSSRRLGSYGPATSGIRAAFAARAVGLDMAVLVLAFAALASGTHNPFIYFRF